MTRVDFAVGVGVGVAWNRCARFPLVGVMPAGLRTGTLLLHPGVSL
jgi:hypothetical protein